MGCKLTDTLFCSCSPFWLRPLWRVLCFPLEPFPLPPFVPFVISLCCCWKVSQWCESGKFSHLNNRSWTAVILQLRLEILNFSHAVISIIYLYFFPFCRSFCRLTVCAASCPLACVLYFVFTEIQTCLFFQVRDFWLLWWQNPVPWGPQSEVFKEWLK